MDFYSAVEEAYKNGYRDGLNSRNGTKPFSTRKNKGTICAQCEFADKTLWDMTEPPQVLCTLTGKPRLANQLCGEQAEKICREK